MTAKSEELYTAVIERISSKIPNFQPAASMSDWEPAPRNAFEAVYPQINIHGCRFHFTQCIWGKTQKLGLTHSFRNNTNVANFIRELMAIPFLPPPPN